MIYGILRTPHQNSRYFEATEKLAKNELILILQAFKVAYKNLAYQEVSSLNLLVFEVDLTLDPRVVKALEVMSTSMAIFEIDGMWMKPLEKQGQAYLMSDLASILKYSGKTNEDFTGLMLNVGVFASDFKDDFDRPLTIFDPMAGKGTTLYKALMSGYHATGVEKEKKSASEMNQYLKRYLKFHHLKHEAKHQTIVISGKNLGTKYTITTANTKEAYKAGHVRTLSFAQGDTLDSNAFHKKNHAHVLVTDLPYGVQHPAAEMMAFLDKASAVWFQMIQKGGVAVIAYNTYHLSKEALASCFEDKGFVVLKEGIFGDFEHWVEQAVNRDILVLKK